MPTRKTLFWLLAAGFLYLIALNVGSGWLYVVTSLLVSFPLAALFLSRINIRRLTLRQTSPEEATAGGGICTQVDIVNPSVVPRFFLRLDADFGGRSASLMLPYLGPRRARRLKLDFAGLKRGFYRGGRFSISSGAPTGLARVRRRHFAESPLVIYPRWQRLPGDWATGMKNSGYLVSSVLPTRSSTGDYLGVREYRPEDSPRSIHWRTTARAGSLAVVEYSRQAAISPVMIVDRYRDGAAGEGPDASFETAVSIAASLIQREVSHNRRFGLGDSPADAAGRGLSHEDARAMLWLARVEAAATDPLDLTAAGFPWPEATPVLILTSHEAYAGLDRSELLDHFPHAAVIMLDGRGFEKDEKRQRRFLDGNRLNLLAAAVEAGGGRFVLVPSPDEVVRCLEDL